MLKYLDNFPYVSSKSKADVYRKLLCEFSQANKPFAIIDENKMPKTNGRFYNPKTREFERGPYFNAEFTVGSLNKIVKAEFPNVRVMRKEEGIYLINTDIAKEWKKEKEEETK